ncbi:MAG: GNAT family N-acetyltransferase [Mesorhizobium sp.]|nr:MAG: GNAT family N-acetyltransferase [Mesorhizobium sp.]
MPSQRIVRPVTRQDYEQWLPLWDGYNARGQGVGRALIEGVYERAGEAGANRVYWLTHETNHTAMQLYDKVGEKSGFVVYRKMF